MATRVPTPYYRATLESGLHFQDFVIDQLRRRGLTVTNYSSKAYQIWVGENAAKMEIKLDDRLAQTGKLWIEVLEKSDPGNREWVTAGIFRESVEYVIGNYDRIYRLPTRFLRLIFELGQHPFISENNLKTSLGFLLPAYKADRLAIQVLEVEKSDPINNMIAIQRRQLREEVDYELRALCAAVHKDPNQFNLNFDVSTPRES